jgi:hypothetical protein
VRMRERLQGVAGVRVSRSRVKFFFFIFIVPLKPNRFGSVGVLPVSGFGNRNRTEQKIFTKKIIGLIGFFFRFGFFCYFFLGFLGLLGFSVFLLTPSLSDFRSVLIFNFQVIFNK